MLAGQWCYLCVTNDDVVVTGGEVVSHSVINWMFSQTVVKSFPAGSRERRCKGLVGQPGP